MIVALPGKAVVGTVIDVVNVPFAAITTLLLVVINPSTKTTLIVLPGLK